MSGVLARNWPARIAMRNVAGWPARIAMRNVAGWPARIAMRNVAGGGDNAVFRKRTAVSGRVFALRKTKQRAVSAGKISLKTVAVLVAGSIVFAGAFYLYQVNNITIKGYEVKDVESKIQSLEKENQKLKIREVESKSMQNIEKSTEELNLIKSSAVLYIERKGPMAMK